MSVQLAFINKYPKGVRQVETVRQKVDAAIYTNSNKQVFLFAGQSNITGRGARTYQCAVPIADTVKEYVGATSTLKNLVEPCAESFGGSLMSTFGIHYHSQTGIVPVCVQGGKAGSGLTVTSRPDKNWSTSGTLFSTAVSYCNSAMTAVGVSAPRGIIWCQGEEDGYQMDINPAYTRSMVKTALIDLITRFRTQYPNTTFYMIRTGKRGINDTDGTAEMRVIQEEILAEFTHVKMAYRLTDNFFEYGMMMEDEVHYNQWGQNEIGVRVAQFIIEN